ncbi:hypothetical protein TSUD_278910 [Trifolium subterraneum]|uniref:Xaa-Pro dipeptidyl-peptidase-like domain-containing protein n=1 Tax=Trifolium subterraneum TaxID=3900 RepID=A0A2Z6MWV3_TRISU|nr:hypothetical protein TSUD_278910 [Trifolium subterraneum]
MSSSSNFTVESVTVETNDNGVKLHTRLFKPGSTTDIKDQNFAIILIHPYSVLGGSQGLLKGIASGLAVNGYTSITFDMRGVGKSTGRPSITGFAEVKDVVSVSNWIQQVIGYVSIGYPFGITASILFGRHHKAILQSPKPKLFIMGTEDGFTSVKQLKNKLKSAAGRVETHLIDGVGHFQMEGPAYDSYMIRLLICILYSNMPNSEMRGIDTVSISADLIVRG